MAIPSPIVGVHLDLKYMISSKSYLLDWVRDLPGMGVNTLLIEYEDKFPYQKYPFLQATGAFTPRELKLFLSTARQAGLTVIPLIQTLSHLEFALGHPELAHLRETPDTPTQIDTSNPQAVAFVRDLIDEVLAYHQEDELFHLGADETWHLGHNERTAKVREELGLLGMWTQHTNQFINHVKAAGKRAIVWDDIFWSVKPEEIAGCTLDRDVMLHCWSYGSGNNEKSLGNLSRRVSNYQQAGFATIAGPCLNWGVITPRHEHCLLNTHGWAITANNLKMEGMINTAWSCFHTLPNTENLQIAAMGQMMRDPSTIPSQQWQDEFMSNRLGCDATGYAQAMIDGTAFWELDCGLERPLTTILYGNMDMVLWYGSQDIRKKQGAYPFNFNDINFDELFRRKLAYFVRGNTDGKVVAQYATYIEPLTRATQTLRDIAARATRHVDEVEYMLWVAEMKLAHVQIMIDVLEGRAICSRKINHWARLGTRGFQIMQTLVEPYSIWQMINILWKPLTTTFKMAPITRPTEA